MRLFPVMFVMMVVTAHADTFPVRGMYGELIESPKPCGPVTRDEIQAFVAADLTLYVTDDSISYSTRDSTYEVPADKRYVQDGQTIGIWYRGRRSIVMAIRPLKKPVHSLTHGLTISFLVEKDEKERNSVSCFERWVGSVKP